MTGNSSPDAGRPDTINANPALRAVLIVGHGSLRPGSGASMIRLAARAQSAGIAPICQAAFLNYSRPTVREGVERCVALGASEIVVAPYFLVPGYFVRHTLPRQIAACRAELPGMAFLQADALGDHPALAQLTLQRAAEAEYLDAHPELREQRRPSLPKVEPAWRPLHQNGRTGLLMIAHGSPEASNNAPIHAVAERVRASERYAAVTVCFMDLNEPSIGAAIDDFAERGISHAVAVPFFLQLGSHVAEDLPALVAESQARHPLLPIILAEHLGYDRLLLQPLAERVAAAVSH